MRWFWFKPNLRLAAGVNFGSIARSGAKGFCKGCLLNELYIVNPDNLYMCNIPDSQIRILEKEQIDCADIKELMGDYADQELTETLQNRLDEHFESCSACMQFKQEYLMTISLARTLRTPPISNDVQNRLRKALNEKLGLNLEAVS